MVEEAVLFPGSVEQESSKKVPFKPFENINLLCWWEESEEKWLIVYVDTARNMVSHLMRATALLRKDFPGAKHSPISVSLKTFREEWLPKIQSSSEPENTAIQIVPKSESMPANVQGREFKRLVDYAIKIGASDIHIARDEGSAHIRLRANGVMHEYGSWAVEEADKIIGAKFNEVAKNSPERVSTWSSNKALSTEFRGAGGKDNEIMYSIRYQQMPNRDRGWDVVMRVLVENNTMQKKGLGYSKEQQDLLFNGIRRPQGLTIMAGPTGSGKTTALAICLRHLSRIAHGEKNIITLEDPPEIKIEGVRQFRLPHDEERDTVSFAQGLKQCMRMDPDVLMVGEVRDAATANMLVETVLTGHQVFSTIHASSAIATVARLLDLGVEPNILNMRGVLSAVVYQTLLKTYNEEQRQYVKTIEDLDALSRHFPKTRQIIIKCVGENEPQKNQIEDYLHNHNWHTVPLSATVADRQVCAEVFVPSDVSLDLLVNRKFKEAFDVWVSEGGVPHQRQAITLSSSGSIPINELEGLL